MDAAPSEKRFSPGTIYAFGRATDLACLHVRRGRLARHDAMRMVKLHDGKFPWQYLGCPLPDILKDIDMTLEEFITVCDRFTNKKLFQCDAQGRLVKDKDGNLVKVNDDNRVEIGPLGRKASG